jgi:hypothetical protein
MGFVVDEVALEYVSSEYFDSPAFPPTALNSSSSIIWVKSKQKQTPLLLVLKRTISTERPLLVSEVSAKLCGYIYGCGTSHQLVADVRIELSYTTPNKIKKIKLKTLQ